VEHRDWKILTEQVLFEAPPFLHISAQALELPDGRRVDAYYQVRMPDVATTFAETADHRVVVLRSYRHGARRTCLGFPGGHMVPGEDPLVAARRELREETGYEGGEPRVLGCFELNPSWQKTAVHAVLVRGVRRAGEKDEDEGEDIRVRLLSAAEVRRRVLAGEIDAAATLCALALWDWGEGELAGGA
jgi:ADP-ribose pyrophosphatase